MESERLQAEIRKEQELGKLKTAMMLRISHEFRTPLSVILSSADILDRYAERISTERKQGHLDKIRAQVSHLTGIIDAIHLSVQGIFDNLEFRPQGFNLPTLCREILVEQKSRQRVPHPIDLNIEGEGQPFSGDMNLVRLTLQNLISNAIKFSPEGKSITISLKISPDSADFEIRDQGIGIPADEFERVFDPFYRASGIGETPGLGIGLSIAQDAVDAHRGKLWLEHNPAGGIIAHVRFPNAS
jgi:signal transduction histidine kinase